MTTKKGVFNTLVGVIMTIIISIFQLTFLFVLNSYYEHQFVGLFRVIISFLTYLSLTEGGLGIITIFSLYRPLQENNYESVNDIINTTRKNYQHTGKIYLVIIAALAFGIGLIKQYSSQVFVGLNINLQFWQFALLIIFLSSKELLFFYFSGAYQNLIQADQRGYLNRLVFIFSEVIMYILLIALATIPKMPVYVPFVAYALCGLLKILFTFIIIKIEYPWLQHKKWIKQKRLLKQSWWIALNRIPELIISNIDVILITVLLSLNVTSIYTYYLIIATTIKNIALILVNSFREVFGYWIAKNGRIRWATYTKFEMYAYMAAAFSFMVQFLVSQYIVAALYGKQYLSNSQDESIFFNFFLNSPTFIFFLSLKNMFEVATEPGKVIVNATVKYKETIWSSYIQAFIVLGLAIILGTSLHYLDVNRWALYLIIASMAIGWIYRLLYIWIYVWKNLTYNSDLRFIVQNSLILLLPVLITSLFGYFYLFDTFKPISAIDTPKLALKILGYSLLSSFGLVTFLAMTINFRQFWSTFNLKNIIRYLFKKQKRVKTYEQEMNELLKDSPEVLKNFTQTLDFTNTYQFGDSGVDKLVEQELLKKQLLAKEVELKNKQPSIGIYKIRG